MWQLPLEPATAASSTPTSPTSRTSAAPTPARSPPRCSSPSSSATAVGPHRHRRDGAVRPTRCGARSAAAASAPGCSLQLATDVHGAGVMTDAPADADVAGAAGQEGRCFLDTHRAHRQQGAAPGDHVPRLCLLVIVLSRDPDLFDISVTEDVAVPVPVPARGALPGGSVVPELIAVDGDRRAAVRRPTTRSAARRLRGQEPAVGRRHPLHLLVVRRQLPGFGVVGVTSSRWPASASPSRPGMMAALIRKLVKVAPAEVAGVHRHLRRRALERRLRRRLPHAHPARRGGVNQRRAASAGRHGRRVRRGRRDLRRQHPDHADRRHAHRDHERGDPPRRAGRHRSTITANFYFSIASTIFARRRHRRSSTTRIIEPRPRPVRRRRRRRRARRRGGARARARGPGPALRPVRRCSPRVGRGHAADVPAGGPAARTRRPAPSSATRRSWTA